MYREVEQPPIMPGTWSAWNAEMCSGHVHSSPALHHVNVSRYIVNIPIYGWKTPNIKSSRTSRNPQDRSLPIPENIITRKSTCDILMSLIIFAPIKMTAPRVPMLKRVPIDSRIRWNVIFFIKCWIIYVIQMLRYIIRKVLFHNSEVVQTDRMLRIIGEDKRGCLWV